MSHSYRHLFTLLFFSFLTFGSQQARASWGCEVLLCMANPAGPMAAGACVPPIKKLYKALMKGKPFPTCAMATNQQNGTASWADHTYEWYDACPVGTTELPYGQKVVQGNKVPDGPFDPDFANVTVATAIGDGSQVTPDWGKEGNEMPAKVCGAGQVGAGTVLADPNDFNSQVLVDVYQQVTYVAPRVNPNVVKVYVDNQLKRVVQL